MIQFINECNFLNEANGFLLRYFNNSITFDVLHDDLKKKSGYTKDMKITLEALKRIYTEVLAEVKIPEYLAIYYEMEDEEIPITGCLADCMILEGICSDITSLPQLRQYMKKCFHENPTLFINSALRIPDDPPVDMEKDEFMKSLEKLDAKDSVKWNIWRVFNDFDNHLDLLMDVMEQMIPIMKRIYKNYVHCFQPFYTYWNKICEEERFVEQMSIMLKIDLMDASNIKIYPSWMGCNGVRLYSSYRDENQMYLFLGLIFKDEGVLVSSTMTREELCGSLKILSDASKYEIMNLIKTERLYGSQLAEKLGLSTATISHHVNALSCAGLITLEKDSNRVYYRLNKSQVGILLDQLRKDLYD